MNILGLSARTTQRLLLTVALVVGIVVLRAILGWLLRLARLGGHAGKGTERVRFWSQQTVSLLTMLGLILGVLVIWVDQPGRLGGAAGLVTAGIAVALQRVITSFAAYVIILRGRIFSVGDRITIGGVRGDVVALGFMQTSVMEMGQPPAVQSDPPAIWVEGRQYTGRLVRVTNDKIFDSPVYNYTREFPYLWEEIRLPVKYGDDRNRAEQILLEAARRHTAELAKEATAAIKPLREVYYLPEELDVEPSTYYRLTDNWLELSVRFIARERGVRGLKDRMSRDILAALEAAGIGIASGTYEIVGVPPLKVEVTGDAAPGRPG